MCGVRGQQSVSKRILAGRLTGNQTNIETVEHDDPAVTSHNHVLIHLQPFSKDRPQQCPQSYSAFVQKDPLLFTLVTLSEIISHIDPYRSYRFIYSHLWFRKGHDILCQAEGFVAPFRPGAPYCEPRMACSVCRAATASAWGAQRLAPRPRRSWASADRRRCRRWVAP